MPSHRILKLQVENFRNLEKQIIQFSPKINCIFGSNGNGKTNLLEAIYYLITHKSFRKRTSFPQLVGIDSEKPEIILGAFFEDDQERLSYSGRIQENSSEWYIDSKLTKRKLTIPVLFINPFDSYNFHSQASFRRTWFDDYIGLYDTEYKKCIKKLNQSLKFRNTLLQKKPSNYTDQIQAIDLTLSKIFFDISLKRSQFLNVFSEYCSNTFFQLFSEKHTLDIILETKWSGLSQEKIYQQLQNNLEKDLVIGYTVKGVHKDDYMLLYDGLNSYDYCSLGQQKMSYLSLLFAYIELFRYKFSSFPIVLIDDVSGELDRVRWSNLIKYLNQREFQVLITTANEKFKEEFGLLSGIREINIYSGLIE